MPDTKKRTTSTEVKQRYLDKTYTQFNVRLRNEDAAEILEFIESKGWSKAEFIKNAFDALTRQK